MAGSRVEEHLVDGRYELKEQLGRGGFGIVWRGHDTLLRRDVAIKEVHFPSMLDDRERASLRDKVLREARAAARVSHPALVTVFDVVDDGERPLIVMELVDAPTLAERVAAQGPLPDQEAATVGQEILEALATAHAHGIVHRDVKPANVMVSDSGRVQLGDFGVASALDDPKVTSSGRLAGSPSYMAPEQAHNRPAGAATDLWGLGATLYYAVEGQPPFERDGALATLTSVVTDEPRPMQRAKALAPLLEQLLVKDPAARPPVEDVRRRLADIAAGDSAGDTAATVSAAPTMEFDAPPASPPPPPQPAAPQPAAAPPVVRRRAERPRPGLVPLLVAGVLVVGLVAVLLATAGDRSPSGGEAPAGGSTTTGDASAAPVPGSWVGYTDPATGFTISHPPSWSIERNGTLTDFRDPATGAYLRVDYTTSPGPSAEQAWIDFEPRFAAENADYRRIRIEPTRFQGFPAAVWEFTYTGGGAQLRAVDLGFVTGDYGFALNFQTRAEHWEDMQDEFEAFKASFGAPSG